MRKAEQSARTKSALIEAAIALFAERGYRATPLKAIGERAGISHGVIPFHFGNKEGLLQAVVETSFARFADSVLSLLRAPAEERDYGLRDLTRLLNEQVDFSEANPEIGRVFQVLMSEAIGPSPELRPHFQTFHKRLHRLGCEWMREGQARGAIRENVDVEATIDAILALLTGIRTHHLLTGVDRRRIHRQVIAILKSGIEREEPEGE